MNVSSQVYLLKHEDGTVFGPLELEKLKAWADQALVSPLDKISTDKSEWVKAPMIPELNMDWLIEVSLDQLYGPTTLGALKEFLDAGEIDEQTTVLNCCDGERVALSDLQEMMSPEPDAGEGAVDSGALPSEGRTEPAASSIKINLQQRVHDLEEALLEERRYSASLEAKIGRLEAAARAAGVTTEG